MTFLRKLLSYEGKTCIKIKKFLKLNGGSQENK